MTTSQDMDEIDLFGKKLPKKSATVNLDPDEKIPVAPINLPDLGPNQFPKDCNQLYNYGQRRSAIYQISPDGTNVIKAR